MNPAPLSHVSYLLLLRRLIALGIDREVELLSRHFVLTHGCDQLLAAHWLVPTRCSVCKDCKPMFTFSVRELIAGFQDVAFLPYRASFSTTFLKHCGRDTYIHTAGTKMR